MSESVVIEEILIRLYNQQYRRKFIFSNPDTNFELTIGTASAGILSCELEDHEIVASNVEESGDERQLWDSHVHGYDAITLCLRDPSRKEITYQLDDHNLLTVEGKGFNSVVQPFVIAPCFFNLNCVENRPVSLVGHRLHIEPSHSTLTIMSKSEALPFISRTPVMISEDKTLNNLDTIFSANASNVVDSFLKATLSYGERSMVITLYTEQCSSAHLRVRVQDGAIAFLPHNMSKFKISYHFRF